MVDAHFRAHQQKFVAFQFLLIERTSIAPDDVVRLGGMAFELI
jgi:hypothetical protein